MIAALSTRRPAGVRFEVVPPPLAQVLPRMDVALFVGFAASGPLNIPVVVDDPAHFESIFGSDAPLAWYRPPRAPSSPVATYRTASASGTASTQGSLLNAYLAPAVRSYFLNGGQRCWVVRVAGPGTTNAFALSGMLARTSEGQLVAATGMARSQGGWSDDRLVAASLVSRALSAAPPALPDFPLWVDVVATAQDDVVAGDLVRITFREGPTETRVAIFVVGQVAAQRPPAAPGLGSQATTRLTPVQRADATPDVTWFASRAASIPLGASGQTILGTQTIPAVLQQATGGTFQLDLGIGLGAAPSPGAMVAVDFGRTRLWLMVTNISASATGSSPPAASPAAGQVTLTGEGLFLDPMPNPVPPSSTPRDVERLRLALQVHQGTEALATLGDLGFDPSHPRAFWALPSDEELFRASDDVTETDPRSVALRQSADAYAQLWSDASEPRFDLASADQPGTTYFPLGMPYTPAFPLGPFPNIPTRLERDGLSNFGASLFLDPDLADVDANALLAQADFIRYQSSTPRRLQGIHAALGVDEATLIAVPDATLPGWIADAPPLPPPPTLAPPLASGTDGSFAACSLRALSPPNVTLMGAPDGQGTFVLAWDAVSGAVQYEIEESPDPQLSRSLVTYTTPDTQLTVYGHASGLVFLRGRATAGSLASGWSAAIAVPVLAGSEWVTLTHEANRSPALANVQAALLTTCAARGDLFALLSLPASQTAADAALYLGQLCASQSSQTLGYGAVYHPWIVGRDTSTGPLRTTPPDGAMAGLYARRTRARGAWIAPANEPLAANVLGLSPQLADAAWSVLDALPVNRIRQEARGLMAMRADTLSGDPNVALVNVRRLLMLLRRAALDLGTDYVFEPNSPALARAVNGAFSSMLEGLYRLGALAGATAGDAYRVVTDGTVNTPASMERGRFVVELQVAPSSPLSFLTVRLVQTGDQLVIVQGS